PESGPIDSPILDHQDWSHDRTTTFTANRYQTYPTPQYNQDRVPTIHGNRCARDEIRRRARQEHRHPGKVVDMAPSTGRGAGYGPLLQAGYLLSGCAGQLGVNPTRQEGVDLDPVESPRGSQGFRELHDAAFARTIRRRKRRAEDRQQRADVNDLAPARALEVRMRALRTEKCARQVGVHDVVPLGDGEILGRLPDIGARIVDQNVEAAASL